MKVPIPALSPDTLFPPILHHPQGEFWRAAENPFEPDRTTYSPVNAWWLAEAAMLAYHDQQAIREKLPASWALKAFFSNDGTQAYVAASATAVIVAFRGTEIRNAAEFILDWITNFTLQLEPEAGGQCHGGFIDGVNRVYSRVSEAIDQARAPNLPVWFCGHSLGAALATIAARRYPQAHALYSYGSPRTGDPAFCSSFPIPVFRIANDRDMVPHVPGTAAGYSHAGESLHIDADGSLHHREPPASWIPSLIHHAPLLYSLYLANQLG